MRTAFIQDGSVHEILPLSGAPIQERYPADFLASCREIADDVQEGWVWNGTDFAAPSLPAPTMADRLGALAAERYARQTSGVLFQAATAAAPSLAASDPNSTAMMTSSYVAARDGHWVDGTPWKMADGGFVSLTAADMQGLALKTLGFVAACYAHEGVLAKALASDLTADITAGWPANT